MLKGLRVEDELVAMGEVGQEENEACEQDCVNYFDILMKFPDD